MVRYSYIARAGIHHQNKMPHSDYTASFKDRHELPQTKYKLIYFGITGLGEHIRVALALAGIPFEDEKVTGAQWAEMKATLPAGTQLPMFGLMLPLFTL